MSRIDLLPYDNITTKMLNEYTRRVQELPPPPEGFHYSLSSPEFKFKDNEWEVTTYIILEENGKKEHD